jgi:hypothetical protein
MHPKTHAGLMQIISVGYLPLLLIFIFALMSKSSLTFTEMGSTIFLIFAILGIYGLLYLAVRYVIPVRCSQPGCNGKMECDYSRRSNTEGSLTYNCIKCHVSYQKTIFILPKGRGGFGGSGH